MKNSILLFTLILIVASAFGQSSELTPFQNTGDRFNKWTYEGTELRRMKFNDVSSILRSANDDKINAMVRSSRGMRTAGMVMNYTGMGIAIAGAALVLKDIPTGLSVAIPGLTIQIIGAIIGGAGKSKLKKSILRYNAVCQMNVGMASQSLGPGLYIDLK